MIRRTYIEAISYGNNNQMVALNTMDMHYLRLMMHGYNPFEIANFLEIEIDYIQVIRGDLLKKVNTTSWCESILIAFRLGYLNKMDFVDEIVKEEAVKFINIITKDSQCVLKPIILDFYNTCANRLLNTKQLSFNLTVKKYLELKYQGLADNFLDRHYKQPDDVDNDEQLKIQINDWFDKLKKVFEFQVLPKEEHLKINIDSEAILCSEKIVSIDRNLTEAEKRSHIYNNLIHFFNAIEYYYLLNQDY